MAYQLALTHKVTGLPVDLVALDGEICQALGQPVDTVNWVYGWMDTVGLCLAAGNDRDSLKGYMREEKLLEVWDYITTHYNNVSYYTR